MIPRTTRRPPSIDCRHSRSCTRIDSSHTHVAYRICISGVLSNFYLFLLFLFWFLLFSNSSFDSWPAWLLYLRSHWLSGCGYERCTCRDAVWMFGDGGSRSSKYHLAEFCLCTGEAEETKYERRLRNGIERCALDRAMVIDTDFLRE